jgi:DNA-binding MarR family transcriptional regulator
VEGLGTVGFRGYHYRLLAALAEFGPGSQITLGQHTSMDRSDVVAALNELAGRGLVERAADPADRRRNVVSVTPAGLAELAALDHVVARVQDELLAPLSGDDRDHLLRLLCLLTEGAVSDATGSDESRSG